jgi:hypothetical protein
MSDHALSNNAGLVSAGNAYFGDSPTVTVQVMETEEAMRKCRDLSR